MGSSSSMVSGFSSSSIVCFITIFKVGMKCLNVPTHVVSPFEFLGTNRTWCYFLFTNVEEASFFIYLKCSRCDQFGGEFLTNEEEEGVRTLYNRSNLKPDLPC